MSKLQLIAVILAAILTYGCAGDQNPTTGQGQDQGQSQGQDPGPGQDQGTVPGVDQGAAPGGQVPTSGSNYPLHSDVSVTYFWVGEEATSQNSYIPNAQSAWDDKWAEHFGGIDDPNNRNGYSPATFAPSENPFYFALPYNDFDASGKRKKSAVDTVYWGGDQQWGSLESMCKNRWIKIIKGDVIAYAQWEDVGPYGEDDASYVFGDGNPQNTANNDAGLDVSPAVRDYLGLADIDIVDWKFVDPDEVPDGPWKKVITDSQISW